MVGRVSRFGGFIQFPEFVLVVLGIYLENLSVTVSVFSGLDSGFFVESDGGVGHENVKNVGYTTFKGCESDSLHSSDV